MQQVSFEDFALPFIGLLWVGFFCLFFMAIDSRFWAVFLKNIPGVGGWAEQKHGLVLLHFIFSLYTTFLFFSCSHDTTGKLLNSLNINLLLQRKKSKKISCFFIFLFFFMQTVLSFWSAPIGRHLQMLLSQLLKTASPYVFLIKKFGPPNGRVCSAGVDCLVGINKQLSCLFVLTQKKYILGAFAVCLAPRNATQKQLAGCLHRPSVLNKACSWAALSRLVRRWMLSEREITDWSGLHKVLWGFIGRFSLKTTRGGKFSAWIDSSGSWKSFEERTSTAQAKQSHHFSCCLICVPHSSTSPIW